MAWLLKRFTGSNKVGMTARTIEAIYGTIVAQAREPAFYTDCGVPDTVDGRFDMVVLHLWMVLGRLREFQNGQDLSQRLFDHFCADMDDNLREMGVGDLTVPKRMQAFGEAFYGRSAAYDSALHAGEEELVAALNRNILNGRAIDNARRLAAYVKAAMSALAEFDENRFVAGTWQFPSPWLQTGW